MNVFAFAACPRTGYRAPLFNCLNLGMQVHPSLTARTLSMASSNNGSKPLSSSRFNKSFPSLAFLVGGVAGFLIAREYFSQNEPLVPLLLPPEPSIVRKPEKWNRLLEDSCSRWLVAHSIATDPHSVYRFLIHGLIKSNTFSPQEVRKFIYILIEELLSKRATKGAKINIADWLFLLRTNNEPDYQILIKKLHKKGILNELLKPEMIWFTGENFHVVAELRYDIQKYC